MNPNKFELYDPQKSRLAWHEIKKYGTIIRAYLENLEEGVYGKLTEKQLTGIREARQVAQLENTFINNLSQLLKLETNIIETYIEELEIHDLLETAIAQLEPLIKKDLIKIRDLDTRKPFISQANRTYASQTMNNILSLLAQCGQIPGKIDIAIHHKNRTLIFKTHASKEVEKHIDSAEILSKNNFFEPYDTPLCKNKLNIYISHELAKLLKYGLKLQRKGNDLIYQLTIPS